jgi:hypothetical protein
VDHLWYHIGKALYDIFKSEYEDHEQMKTAREQAASFQAWLNRQKAEELAARLRSSQPVERKSSQRASVPFRLGESDPELSWSIPFRLGEIDPELLRSLSDRLAVGTVAAKREKPRRPAAKSVRRARVKFELVGAKRAFSASATETERLLKHLEELRRKRKRRDMKQLGALIDALSGALAKARKIGAKDQRVTVDLRGQGLLLEALTRKKLPENSVLGLLRKELRALQKYEGQHPPPSRPRRRTRQVRS